MFVRLHILTVILVVVTLISGCGQRRDEGGLPAPGATPANDPNAFDPATATARVSGSILFEGTPPTMPYVKITGNPYCRRQALGLKSQEVVVTSDGKLQNVIIYVRSGHEGRSYTAPEAPVVLDQKGCVYTPRVVTIMTKQKLRILNSDDTFHNVLAQGDAATLFNVAQASKGPENVQTFARPGLPFRFSCNFHPWMVAYVGVFDHPFHTTSGDSGRYELHLPPGKYEIVAWHEKYGEKVAKVEVAASQTIQQDFKFSAH